MKDKRDISPEKEKPHNYKEMLMETDNIDISPNVLPSSTKSLAQQTTPPQVYTKLNLTHCTPKTKKLL